MREKQIGTMFLSFLPFSIFPLAIVVAAKFSTAGCNRQMLRLFAKNLQMMNVPRTVLPQVGASALFKRVRSQSSSFSILCVGFCAACLLLSSTAVFIPECVHQCTRVTHCSGELKAHVSSLFGLQQKNARLARACIREMRRCGLCVIGASMTTCGRFFFFFPSTFGHRLRHPHCFAPNNNVHNDQSTVLQR